MHSHLNRLAARLLTACVVLFAFLPIVFAQTAGLPPGLTLDPSTGVLSGTPTTPGTYTFTIQATNAYGSDQKTFTMTVNPPNSGSAPSIGSFTASPSSISVGGSSTLSWSTTNATSWSINQGIGSVSGGTQSVSPTATTTYTLTATGPGGNATATTTVTVIPTITGGPGTTQGAAWPAHAATDSDLLMAADHATTTLSSAITNVALVAPLASTSTFVANQVATVDSEQMKICSAGTSLTICAGGRGFAGTVAVPHSAGAPVNGRVGAVYHNTMAQEIIALETGISTATHHGTFPGTAIAGASWPNHIATAAELYQEADVATSTLAAGMTSTATSFTLTNASYFVANQIILVGNELMKTGAVSGTMVSGVTRGLFGTTAAAHSNGDAVSGVLTANSHNRLASELAALESDLFGTAGSTANCVGTGASLDPANTDSFSTVLAARSLSSIADYEFGTSGNITSISDLANSFNPYGIAGTTVINQEWERYQPFNTTNFVFTTNSLDLTATIPSGGGLFAGGINSGQIWTKATFVPGRQADASTANNYPIYAFEIQMKVPGGVGMWPASWMYAEYPSGDTITPNGSDGSETDNPEFFNMTGQDSHDWTGYQHGPHVGTSIYDLRNSSGVYAPGTDYSAGYHLFQTYWTTDAVYKYLDGVLIYATHFTWSSGSDAQFGANLAVGSSLSGLPGLQPTSTSEFPSALSIKHIKIWGGTTGGSGGSCPAGAGASWPNHAVTTTELLNAVPGAPFTANYHNRMAHEIEALEADLAAHP